MGKTTKKNVAPDEFKVRGTLKMRKRKIDTTGEIVLTAPPKLHSSKKSKSKKQHFRVNNDDTSDERNYNEPNDDNDCNDEVAHEANQVSNVKKVKRGKKLTKAENKKKVSGEPVASQSKVKNPKKKYLNDDEAEVKDEDIDKFCDDLTEEDNEQYENWVKIIEANVWANKKKT